MSDEMGERNITVTIDAEASAGLETLARERGVTPGHLLASFVADLTGTPGNNGINERGMARVWLQRVVWPADPRMGRAHSPTITNATESQPPDSGWGSTYLPSGRTEADGSTCSMAAEEGRADMGKTWVVQGSIHRQQDGYRSMRNFTDGEKITAGVDIREDQIPELVRVGALRSPAEVLTQEQAAQRAHGAQ